MQSDTESCATNSQRNASTEEGRVSGVDAFRYGIYAMMCVLYRRTQLVVVEAKLHWMDVHLIPPQAVMRCWDRVMTYQMLLVHTTWMGDINRA